MKDNPVQGTGDLECPGTEFGWSSLGQREGAVLTKPQMLTSVLGSDSRRHFWVLEEDSL